MTDSDSTIMQSPSAEACLQLAQSCSPFLTRLLNRNCALKFSLTENFIQPFSREEIAEYLNAGGKIEHEAALKSHLRNLRMHVLARLIVRDLNGLADLNEVMHTMTHLAEQCLQFVTEWLTQIMSHQYGWPCAVRKSVKTDQIQSLIIVGMGKLGGRELNVSSDIDLIFAYEEEGETNGTQIISNHEYFTKLCRKLINIFDEVTEDGFVFRVDMRLRPFGSEGALVSSLDALENYYQLYGREWERYAWIKGRVVFGPKQKLHNLLKPFVFRKYLDFSVFSNLRQLKDQIQQDVKRKDLHHNIKLGRGGIREIEFIAQLFQLIRGGKDPELQLKSTLDILQVLAEKQILDEETVNQLIRAYVFLRVLEHRLQYYEDAQTHDLPKNDVHQQNIAHAMQMSEWSALFSQIEAQRAYVSHAFDKILSYQQSTSHVPISTLNLWKSLSQDDEIVKQIAALGYPDAQLVLEKLLQLKQSYKIKHLPESSQLRLNVVMPTLVEICAKHKNGMDTLVRALTLVEAICRRASYLAFFAEYPNVLQRLIDLLSASPWLASYITQHPILLDNLSVSASFEDIDFDAQKIHILNKLNLFAGDTEQQMNILREFHQKLLFKIACEDIVNNVLLTRVSTLLSNLADLILQVVMQVVWDAFPYKHQTSPAFAIIAYGKYGSKELGYSSDLDLVFLYQDLHPEARDIYSKYGARLISWLNTFTSSGMLYEIDTQLRPDGNSGLLVTSVDGFLNYQLEKAWVWEHQALTRARFVTGDANVGDAFSQMRQKILTKDRDVHVLVKEISHMRQRMYQAHESIPEQFNIKHGIGGMVDVEFIAQYLIMVYSKKYPSLLEQWGTAETIHLCAEFALIDQALGYKVCEDYYMYRSQQHSMRLQGQLSINIPEKDVVNAIQNVKALWQLVFNQDAN